MFKNAYGYSEIVFNVDYVGEKHANFQVSSLCSTALTVNDRFFVLLSNGRNS